MVSSDREILLLLGLSGSGKSLFTKQLAARLWKDRLDNSQPIPLWISLSGVPLDSRQIVENFLLQEGFTESEIQHLKANRSFILILDACDEMNGEGLTSIYENNRLGSWQGKVIFTCRTQYIERLDRYTEYFRPKGLGMGAMLQEMTTAPFTVDQVGAYLTQFVKHAKTAWTPAVYEAYIDSLGLREIIDTPFILRIMAEVLPDIVTKHQESGAENELELSRNDLYAAFIDKWFDRQIDKLIRSGRAPRIAEEREFYYQFALKLAQKMWKQKLSQVTYKPSLRRGRPAGEWKAFFGSEKLKVNRALVACPLVVGREAGGRTYRFLHDSLRHFLVTRDPFGIVSEAPIKAADPETGTNQSEIELLRNSLLNDRLMDLSHLQFLADDISKELAMGGIDSQEY